MKLRSAFMTSTLACALALTAESAARACTINGAPVACEYPPIEESVACLPAFAIMPAPAGAAVGTILHRVTMTAPNTSCNDGSPGVFYVRRSIGGANFGRWLIVLDGGGGGFDPAGTLDSGMWKRWSGSSGELLDCVGNGSNDWLDAAAGAPGRDGIVDLPEQAVFRGILDVRSSAFANYNLVFINYCSSDSWTGQVGPIDLHDAGPWTSGADVHQGFKVDFNGHNMVQHVLDLLRDPASWTPDAQPAMHVNDLDNAWVVLVAGESAGGTGVMHNLDWIAGELSGADVLGSIGASHKPPIGAVGDQWFRDVRPPVNGISDIQEGAEVMFDQRARINGFLDASCETGLGVDAWKCQLLSETEPHLATPHFIKQDMSDPLVSAAWPLPDYQAGIKADYNAWRPAGSPPFFAPNCGQHESLNTPQYYTDKLQLFDAPFGLPVGAMLEEVSYNSALNNFVLSGGTGTTFAYDGLSGVRFVPRPPPLPPAVLPVRWFSDCP